MIEVNGEKFYSCHEITERFNEPEQYGENIDRILNRFREVFNWRGDISETYVQQKLYPAASENLIRHVKYQKNMQSRTFVSFSLEDLEKFLDSVTNETVLQKLGKIKNIKVVEAVI